MEQNGVSPQRHNCLNWNSQRRDQWSPKPRQCEESVEHCCSEHHPAPQSWPCRSSGGVSVRLPAFLPKAPMKAVHVESLKWDSKHTTTHPSLDSQCLTQHPPLGSVQGTLPISSSKNNITKTLPWWGKRKKKLWIRFSSDQQFSTAAIIFPSKVRWGQQLPPTALNSVGRSYVLQWQHGIIQSTFSLSLLMWEQRLPLPTPGSFCISSLNVEDDLISWQSLVWESCASAYTSSWLRVGKESVQRLLETEPCVVTDSI